MTTAAAQPSMITLLSYLSAAKLLSSVELEREIDRNNGVRCACDHSPKHLDDDICRECLLSANACALGDPAHRVYMDGTVGCKSCGDTNNCIMTALGTIYASERQ